MKIDASIHLCFKIQKLNVIIYKNKNKKSLSLNVILRVNDKVQEFFFFNNNRFSFYRSMF